jgi:hypothetical protein
MKHLKTYQQLNELHQDTYKSALNKSIVYGDVKQAANFLETSGLINQMMLDHHKEKNPDIVYILVEAIRMLLQERKGRNSIEDLKSISINRGMSSRDVGDIDIQLGDYLYNIGFSNKENIKDLLVDWKCIDLYHSTGELNTDEQSKQYVESILEEPSAVNLNSIMNILIASESYNDNIVYKETPSGNGYYLFM